ncbi:LPS export ABC transporter periplasmic protein LptC [Nisaea acidiphila]|uniref:LPS export ABC transporter periplasmic protein LptC n=1 Tax=Nisaea acidiphila TaxID=1862145 RepID=A0A9J7AWL7_9PROT|nr:LPS export ABC transporter periplasmic protein LptC [Nisaea acidiphila]UUX51759.1 LPS export ABC transporter periplasmic protein LptC [Nisaea acidiphila]
MSEQTAGNIGGDLGARRFMPGAPRRARAAHFRASRLVVLMKLILPALALAIVALIVSWPQLIPDHTKFRLGDQARSVLASATDGLSMDQPRYVGVDEEQRPYEITAERASQDNPDSDRLDLVAPQADLAVNQEEWLALSATAGIYDKKKKTIDLSGGVTVFHDRGYTVSSDSARVLLDEGMATSDDPVSAHGQSGTATGEGFRIYNRGERIVFTGKSKVVLYPSQLGGLETRSAN